MKIFISIIIILINISILKAEIVDRIVAVVNDDVITLSELNKTSKPFLKDENLDDSKIKMIKSKVLDELIDMKLLEQEASRLNIEVTNKEVDEWIEETMKQNSLDQAAIEKAVMGEGLTFRNYKEKVRDNILRIKLMNMEIRPNLEIDDNKLKSYYSENIDKYLHPERIKIKEIFLSIPEKSKKEDIDKVRERAYEILNKMKEGESFESMAVKYSESTSSKNGGDIGYLKIEEISPDFRSVLGNMKSGDISEPFISENGLHIIKLINVENKGNIDFKDVKEEIYRTIINEESEKAFNKWISSLREKAFIDIRF